MKRLSFIFFLLSFSSLTYAQFTQFAEGPVFPDPGPGFAKIIQMKDNSTMFIHVSFTKGLFIHVYEPVNRVRTESKIEPAYGIIQQGNVEGIFEISGDAVVMVSKTANDQTDLYRLIIDGKTGKLKDEKQIASVKKISLKKGNTKLTELAVRKDPNSNNYAVALFGADTSKRAEIIFYGADNKEISRGTYSASKYKNLQYVDMAVIGSNKVAMILYGYEVSASNEKTGELLFASLDKTTKTLAVNEMDYSNDLLLENGITRYDPKINQILLLSTAKVKSESNELHAYIGFIDVENKRLVTNAVINPGEKLQNKYADVFGKRNYYSGTPQNLLLNNDGSFTIVFEEIEVVKEKDTASHSLLRNTAVVTYDRDVTPINAYLVPIDQYVSNNALTAFYQSARENSGQQFLSNSEFKSDVYISDGHNSFIVFNDKEANAQMATAAKPVQFKDLKDADGFYSQLTGNDILISKRNYVFGKPVVVTGEVAHKLGVFTVYDYDRLNGVFVVLKQDKEPGHPGFKLVWLQP